MNKKFTAVAAAAGTLVMAHMALNNFVFFETFHRKATLQDKANEKKRKRVPAALKDKEDPRIEWFNAQQTELCETADEKGRKLSARLLKAEGNVFVIGAHGYRTSAMKDFRYIAKFYHDRGMNLLLADHPAAGESEGSMISFGRDESRAMLCWIEYLKNRFGGDIKIIIHGFSMGASTAMLLADNEAILPNVRFIIADCGYTDMGYQIDRTLKKYGKHTGLLMATLSATSRLVRGFGFGEVRPVDHIKNTLVPILFVHGSRDNITPVEKAQELFNACGGPKDILVVEGAGHMASYRKAPEEYEKAIDAFSGKYIR